MKPLHTFETDTKVMSILFGSIIGVPLIFLIYIVITEGLSSTDIEFLWFLLFGLSIFSGIILYTKRQKIHLHQDRLEFIRLGYKTQTAYFNNILSINRVTMAKSNTVVAMIIISLDSGDKIEIPYAPYSYDYQFICNFINENKSSH